MQGLIVILSVAVAANCLPAAQQYNFQFQKALDNSKIQPTFQLAAEEAKKNANDFLGSIDVRTTNIKDTLAEFPDEVFTQAFKSSSNKIQSYTKSLKPLLNDPTKTAEEKAHQVISSVGPFLDGLISDFQSASSVIENYLIQANPAIQNQVNGLIGSANNAIDTAVQQTKSVSGQITPQFASILDALTADFNTQEMSIQRQMSDSLDFLTNDFIEQLSAPQIEVEDGRFFIIDK